MLPARRARTWPVALAVAAGLAAGCRGPDPAEELVLVPREATPEPGLPPSYELVLTQAAAGDGAAEVWLPLPGTDRFQTVRSVVVEVGPPAAYEVVTGPGGERLVHVTSGAATLRAVVERTRLEAMVDLPARASELSTTLEPAAWVQAASARGLTARLAHGVERTTDGLTVACRWPEALIDGDWLPVDIAARRCALAETRVRLATDLMRATRDGVPVELRSTVALTPR